MGYGHSYKCNRCGEEYGFALGIGFLFSKEYQKEIESMASGKYGKKRQAILKENPLAAVNAEKKLYICDNCGEWRTGMDLTLYAPNDPEKLWKTKFGEKTVEEWGYVPYVMPSDLEEDYHIIRNYERKCPRCRNIMREVSEDEMINLKCPNCGQINEPIGEILWD